MLLGFALAMCRKQLNNEPAKTPLFVWCLQGKTLVWLETDNQEKIKPQAVINPENGLEFIPVRFN